MVSSESAHMDCYSSARINFLIRYIYKKKAEILKAELSSVVYLQVNVGGSSWFITFNCRSGVAKYE